MTMYGCSVHEGTNCNSASLYGTNNVVNDSNDSLEKNLYLP
jgi:hypothetical protein